jgi:hypothetical protein
MNGLQLLGILLAGIAGFALTVEILENAQKRARMRRLRLIERVCWPDPPPALPRPFTEAELLPWR